MCISRAVKTVVGRHNLEVVGSNPTPATSFVFWEGGRYNISNGKFGGVKKGGNSKH